MLYEVITLSSAGHFSSAAWIQISTLFRPENIKYRYDFFFDNCATRVRDIVAASATDTVIFPEREKKKTFRQLIDPYQKVLPWLDLGADMLLGLQADRKATAFV